MDAAPVRYTKTEDGVRLAHWTVGAGDPLMLVGSVPPTGIEGSWESPAYREWVERLSERHAVSSYDPRGTGLSEASPDMSLEPLLTDLHAVVSAVSPDGGALVAGFGGAPVALVFAARHPNLVTHLIIINGLANFAEYSAQTPMAEARRLTDNGDPARVEAYATIASRLLVGSSAGPDESELMQRTLVQNFTRALAVSTYEERQTELDSLDASTYLEAVTAPALVMQSRLPWLDGAYGRSLVARLSSAELRVLQGDALLPEHLDKEAVVALIDAWMFASGGDASLPGGFQTILFTDLEASTQLTQRLGDEGAQELLRGHNVTVRAALDEHGGREVKHTGDGIMAGFPSAVAAVTAALQIQRDMVGGEVRVRVGLNAGEPIAEDDDLFGTAVQLAARITDRAEPGQVLVSRVVADLCAGKTFEFTSVGEATLKGFDEAVTLYEVSATGRGAEGTSG